MVHNTWNLTNNQPASINLVPFNSYFIEKHTPIKHLVKIYFFLLFVVVFQIHLNHISSLVVLPKMTRQTPEVRSDKRKQREQERTREKRDVPKMYPRERERKQERKKRKRVRKRVKEEKERKGRNKKLLEKLRRYSPTKENQEISRIS